MGIGQSEEVGIAEKKAVKCLPPKTYRFYTQLIVFRIRAARILICGLNGFGAEVAKNIILAGVHAVTFLDNKNVTELDACSQFLVPTTSVGKNRALESLARAQALNPMVELKAESKALADMPDDFFQNFNVVVVVEASTKELIRIDNACRLAGVKFFAGDVWGMFGYCFADLQEHNFVEDVYKHKVISKPNEKIKTELVASATKKTLLYPPLQDCLEFDFSQFEYKKQMKRNGPGFVIMRILQKFRDTQKRDPMPQERAADIDALQQIRNEIAPDLVSDSAFEHVFGQVSPAAAIVGGALAQEVIKGVSQKEAPHQNFFLFDPERCVGFVEAISCC